MAPSSVRSPVATTTPRPRPVVTTVPVKAMPTRSASQVRLPGGVGAPLVTGTDSPVRSDSSTCRPLTATRRRSAGTAARLEQHDVAGHELPAVDLPLLPSRTTRARGTTSCMRARTAPSALRSWTKPMTGVEDEHGGDDRGVEVLLEQRP
jgi:hypothetical protein